MRTRTFLGVLACSAMAVGLAAAPAAADPTDDTVVTFELLAGTLDIVAPPSADLGTGAPGTVINGSLGTVAVTDGRAAPDASWLATVTSTDFTAGAATPSETVLASEVDYWSGPATATTGNGTFTPAQTNLAGAQALDNVAPLTAFTHTGGTGNNTAGWSASISVNVPLDSQAGDFTGTVTHSVA
ncbi:hypothetical protein [Actinokineospora sp. NBRC 105648]|uniref:hypothetical protein n=1 Tax=Actinokineospora sp. NBRC 105648 TaxID=3032206 RepID=UPI0024A3F47A|nr:hypothetical protein [Actinokineospora sp. NBRC 105648]GLZ38890.1 hypothetical protein Acsp05_25140 [Actinokineospora sp. NBRC 105648]